MTDDYFDFMHSIDQARGRENNPYSGGSGTLTAGLIKPARMYQVFITGYSVTTLIGLFLAYSRGWEVFLFGCIGVLSAYFYTAPPVRYGYHGFGEISQLINFSLIIGLGSYFVIAQELSWEMVWVVLPLGFMMFSMITINEIPDESMDNAGNKRTLVVKFGIQKAIKLYKFSVAAAYLIIIIGPILKITSPWVYLTLITIPWFFRAYKIVNMHYHDPVLLSPANMYTIKMHNMLGILSIIAYMIQGIENQGTFVPMVVPFLTMIVLYLPVFLTVFVKVLPINATEH